MGDTDAAGGHQEGEIDPPPGFTWSGKPEVRKLHQICYKGGHDAVDAAEEHLQDSGVAIGAIDGEKWNALHWASLGGRANVVDWLLTYQSVKPNKAANEDQCINLNAQEVSGQTALHIAAYNGHDGTVEILLNRNAKVDIKDHNEMTPLIIATVEGYPNIVTTLLKRDAKTQLEMGDRFEQTALHRAARHNRPDIVDILLQNGANLESRDVDGWTPLISASVDGNYDTVCFLVQHIESDETKPQGLASLLAQVTSDEDGKRTALHVAASFGHSDIVEYLLEKKAKFDVMDSSGCTPLMSAIMKDQIDTVRTLLQQTQGSQADTLNNKLTSPLRVAIAKNSLENVQLLAKHANAQQEDFEELDAFLKKGPCADSKEKDPGGDEDQKLDSLTWASEKYVRHGIASILLLYEMDKSQRDTARKHLGSAIGYAAILERPNVLWWLIATSPHDFETKQSIKRARKYFEPQMMERGTQKTASDSSKRKMSRPTKRGSETEEANSRRSVLDILQDPPFAQFYQFMMPETLLKPPRITKDHSAHIFGFFEDGTTCSTIHRVRDVYDVIYDSGPHDIIEKAIAKQQDYVQGHELEDSSGVHKLGSPKFTWVHLPATNIKWMEHLVWQILKCAPTKSTDSDYQKISSFLKDTWLEIPDRESDSRIMRPQFVENLSSREMHGGSEIQPKATNAQHGMASSAVYMPFLSFASVFRNVSRDSNDKEQILQGKDKDICKQILDAATKHNKLIEAYRDSSTSRDRPVIHGCPTLDAAYHHIQADELESRDLDQVVTKQYISKVKNELERTGTRDETQGKTRDVFLPLLRVNQIWMWTIGEKWLISATPYPVDDVEQSWIDGFVTDLNKANTSRSLPRSTEEMMREIIAYCVGSYRRRRSRRPLPWETNKDSGKQDGDLRSELSIRQQFLNYVNEIGRVESELFKRIRYLTDEKHDMQKLFGGLTRLAQQIFSEVKDIRDELHIIQWIAQCQENVQKQMYRTEQTSHLASSYNLDDINRMEKLASRIQEAANSTLSLLQSEIANSEAVKSVDLGKEAKRQGEIFMVFTVITIIFLPMSFLTSLFAVDIENLGTLPGWVFGTIFGTGAASAILILLWFREYFMGLFSGDSHRPKDRPNEIEKLLDIFSCVPREKWSKDQV